MLKSMTFQNINRNLVAEIYRLATKEPEVKGLKKDPTFITKSNKRSLLAPLKAELFPKTQVEKDQKSKLKGVLEGQALVEGLRRMLKRPYVALDTETTGLSARIHEVSLVSLASDIGSFVFDFHSASPEAKDLLGDLIFDENSPAIIGQNIEFDLKMLGKYYPERKFKGLRMIELQDLYAIAVRLSRSPERDRQLVRMGGLLDALNVGSKALDNLKCLLSTDITSKTQTKAQLKKGLAQMQWRNGHGGVLNFAETSSWAPTDDLSVSDKLAIDVYAFRQARFWGGEGVGESLQDMLRHLSSFIDNTASDFDAEALGVSLSILMQLMRLYTSIGSALGFTTMSKSARIQHPVFRSGVAEEEAINKAALNLCQTFYDRFKFWWNQRDSYAMSDIIKQALFFERAPWEYTEFELKQYAKDAHPAAEIRAVPTRATSAFRQLLGLDNDYNSKVGSSYIRGQWEAAVDAVEWALILDETGSIRSEYYLDADLISRCPIFLGLCVIEFIFGALDDVKTQRFNEYFQRVVASGSGDILSLCCKSSKSTYHELKNQSAEVKTSVKRGSKPQPTANAKKARLQLAFIKFLCTYTAGSGSKYWRGSDAEMHMFLPHFRQIMSDLDFGTYKAANKDNEFFSLKVIASYALNVDLSKELQSSTEWSTSNAEQVAYAIADAEVTRDAALVLLDQIRRGNNLCSCLANILSRSAIATSIMHGVNVDLKALIKMLAHSARAFRKLPERIQQIIRETAVEHDNNKLTPLELQLLRQAKSRVRVDRIPIKSLYEVLVRYFYTSTAGVKLDSAEDEDENLDEGADQDTNAYKKILAKLKELAAAEDIDADKKQDAKAFADFIENHWAFFSRAKNVVQSLLDAELYANKLTQKHRLNTVRDGVSLELLQKHPFYKLPNAEFGLKLVSYQQGLAPHYMHAAASTGRMKTNGGLALATISKIARHPYNNYNIRDLFQSRAGEALVVADYSQMELFIGAAAFQMYERMHELMQGDVHWATGKNCILTPAQKAEFESKFGHLPGGFKAIPEDDSFYKVAKAARQKAKTVNFGTQYGMAANKLAANLGISQAEARNILEKMDIRHPGRRLAQDFCQLHCRNSNIRSFASGSSIEHILGAELMYPANHIRTYNVAGFSRMAVKATAALNFPVQSSGAEIMKLSAGCVFALLKFECRASLYLHDEIVFSVPESRAAEYAAVAGGVMNVFMKSGLRTMCFTADSKTPHWSLDDAWIQEVSSFFRVPERLVKLHQNREAMCAELIQSGAYGQVDLDNCIEAIIQAWKMCNFGVDFEVTASWGGGKNSNTCKEANATLKSGISKAVLKADTIDQVLTAAQASAA